VAGGSGGGGGWVTIEPIIAACWPVAVVGPAYTDRIPVWCIGALICVVAVGHLFCSIARESV